MIASYNGDRMGIMITIAGSLKGISRGFKLRRTWYQTKHTTSSPPSVASETCMWIDWCSQRSWSWTPSSRMLARRRHRMRVLHLALGAQSGIRTLSSCHTIPLRTQAATGKGWQSTSWLPVLRHLLDPWGFKALLVNLLGLAHSHRSSLACWRVCLPQFPSRPSWWISLSYRISRGPKACLQWTCKSWSRNSRHLSLGHQTLFCPNMGYLA